MRKRRGLSTIIGAVFFIIAMTITIGYVSYSMDTLDKFVQTVVVKSSVSRDTVNEEFVVSKIALDNNKFNITVFNPGNIPVKLTRLWVDNKTDTDWVAKYDLNEDILSGQIVTNIGQNIPLSALETASYSMKLVTERGNSQNLFVNSVGEESLYLKMWADPGKITTNFNSIISLQLTNNGTSTLLNLKPEMDSVTTPVCSALCSYQYISGPDPASYATLEPGDSATFEWIYEINGIGGDKVSFSASLVNGIDEVSTSVTVGNVLFAEQAGVVLEAIGLGKSSLSSDILLFHQETALTPNSKYQMYSGATDGGTDGTRIQMESTTPNFFTNNATSQITVPAGLWTASLQLQSEAMPTTLMTSGEDMIFHFEDGVSQNPDNSERTTNERDLEICSIGGGSQGFPVAADPDDAEERVSSGSMDTGSSDLEIPYVSSNLQAIGMRFPSVTVPPGATITDAYVQFTVDEDGTSGSPTLKIWGENVNNANTFSSTDGDITGRTTTTASVSWASIPSWVGNVGSAGTDQRTPNLSSIIQEIIGISGWGSGNAMVIIIKDDGTSGSNTRIAEAIDGTAAPTLNITWTVAGAGGPSWQTGTGPHSSGSYYFDGVDDCFRSQNDVSAADDNDIESEPDTTSLWFKTDGAVTSEQYLVYWEGGSDYHKISLDNVGKVLFGFSTGGTDITTCLSTNEYDDSNWYHVVAVRQSTLQDACQLYITDLNGNDAEPVITQDNSYSSGGVDSIGKWYVGSNKAENGNWFKGWIDDIIHWSDKELSAAEADDISKTNYGTGAHQFGITLDLTDEDGNFISNVYSASGTSIAFQDSKALGDNNDAGYGISNATFNLPQVVVPILQRLNFSMNFVSSTSTWEALDVDMKIDDATMTPYSSFLQIPKPDITFPSYFIHDNDNELDVFVSITGTSGIYMTSAGTRIVFNGTAGEGSFVGMIKSVNGTIPTFDVLGTKDSIYIPPGSKAQIYFYKPTDHPSVQPPVEGTVIVPGTYDTSVWLHAFTDLGETFSHTVKLGTVLVVE